MIWRNTQLSAYTFRVYIPQKKEVETARGSLAEYLNSRFMAGE